MLQGMVKELTATEAHLSNGDVLPYGLAVWSTGTSALLHHSLTPAISLVLHWQTP